MEQVLQVRDLVKHFPARKFTVRAVDGVSFDLYHGETLGLVGESGCGKSTTGRLLLNLLRPTSGQVLFEGKSIYQFNKAEMQHYRRNAQIIFQDCFASLSPRMKAGDIVKEALKIHQVGANDKERTDIVRQIFADVTLTPDQMERYPHEFSGGQRQRIGIARAICLRPQIVICDEPVSALDVSIQAQIINMMKEIQEKYQLAYVFISHDLGVVKHISDRVAVMYLGRIVEYSEKRDLYDHPLHPYAQALLAVIPVADPEVKRARSVLKDEINYKNIGHGCRFASRCQFCRPECTESEPELKEAAPGHFVACHLYD